MSVVFSLTLLVTIGTIIYYNSFSLTLTKSFPVGFYVLCFVVWSVGVFWFVVLLLLFVFSYVCAVL